MAHRLVVWSVASFSLVSLAACAASRDAAPGSRAPLAYQQNGGSQFAFYSVPCSVPLGQIAAAQSMWFVVPKGCGGRGGSIGKVSLTTGAVQTFVPAKDMSPYALAQDSSVVFAADRHAEGNKRFIYSFDENGYVGRYELPYAISVSGEVTGPDGNLWFCGTFALGGATFGGVGHVSYYGPNQFFVIKELATPKLESIATGSDGNLWVTDSANGTVLRISLEGAVRVFSVGGNPYFITSAAGGLVFSDIAAAQLSVMSTAGQVKTVAAPAGEMPAYLAQGAGDDVIFADAAGGGLGVFDAQTREYGKETAVPYSGVQAAAQGPDGNFWFTNASGQVGADLAHILKTSPASFAFQDSYCSATLKISETAYNGIFNVKSLSPEFASITPLRAYAGYPFNVTGRRGGSTQILVQDELQNVTSVPVTVAASCPAAATVFVSAYGEALLYDVASLAQIGSISTGLRKPEGLTVDAAGDLFVADYYGGGGLEFPYGEDDPSRTYEVPPYSTPLDIARCADGTLYIATLQSGVSIYANGATSPTGTIDDSDGAGIIALACDAGGDIYVGYNSRRHRQPRVREFPPGGGGSGTLLPMSGGSGLALDRDGDLVSANTATGTIDFWAPGAKAPYKSLTTFRQRGLALEYLKFGADENELWVVVGETNGQFTYEIDTNGNILATLPFVENGGEGVAVYPPDTFAGSRVATARLRRKVVR